MGKPVIIKAKKDYDGVYEPERMNWLRLQYYRYQVTFGPYVFTSHETFVFNTIVLLLLFLIGWAVKSILVKLAPPLWNLGLHIPSATSYFFQKNA
ncbi:serine palmitoyl transferase A subunit [Schizosaccharomyces cryophilus OY26]|uniref:Serine palmitoyl transferase A subunit n=1 Tax=Schizosaccharomyces cryophilus (strain OY26 / ATCC MYA-4695 / CBS 11777 / NBRC 106824 / NRRL Y48691) TaxID=653667 RepID=S9XCA1_SCHCR|nr:serine palmitoyl transferase A subunit [Schizosaccharomyces cryophilus OY26]EPY51451.1 serine palmitoyl transferase A subunit [Schizosaccharomyces cryophilus OY26]